MAASGGDRDGRLVRSDLSPEGLLTLITASKNMGCIAAFESVGTNRGAAAMCGVDPKKVRRKVVAHRQGVLDEERAQRAPVAKNTDIACTVVTDKIRETKGRMSAATTARCSHMPVPRDRSLSGHPSAGCALADLRRPNPGICDDQPGNASAP